MDYYTKLYSDTVKTVEADSSDINSQIIGEWVWNSDDTHKLVVSCKKHDGTVINRFVDLDSNLISDIVKVTLTQGKDNIITVQRDTDIWKPFLIIDGEYGTFNAVTNFWKGDNGGKIAVYSQSGIADRNVSIWYIKAAK